MIISCTQNVLIDFHDRHIVRAYLPYLPKAFREAGKVLRKLLMGSEGNEETWRGCVTDTNNVLGFAVGAMFIRQSFQGKSKPLAESMITYVNINMNI
jgi:endothelin-converting enzyme